MAILAVFDGYFGYLALSSFLIFWYFFREDSAPKIQNSDCDDCPLCRSRSSQLRDSCDSIDTQHGNSFYAMVVAHKDYINATITFSALNLDQVTETSDWNLTNLFLEINDKKSRKRESPKKLAKRKGEQSLNQLWSKEQKTASRESILSPSSSTADLGSITL